MGILRGPNDQKKPEVKEPAPDEISKTGELIGNDELDELATIAKKNLEEMERLSDRKE